eukprot:scaffold6683_cov103-Cylindrotheca_fusiformis.AAC.1
METRREYRSRLDDRLFIANKAAGEKCTLVRTIYQIFNNLVPSFIRHHTMVAIDMPSTATNSFTPSHELDSPEFTFPFRLYLLLRHAEEQGMGDIISWTEDGKGFKVHNPSKFESMFLAENFKMKKYASFTRQLCAYGFSCIRKGRQPGLCEYRIRRVSSNFHPDFTRDNPDACSKIYRGKGKSYGYDARRLYQAKTQQVVPLNVPGSPLTSSSAIAGSLPTTPPFPSIFGRGQKTSSVPSQMETEYLRAVNVSSCAPPNMSGKVMGNLYTIANTWNVTPQQTGAHYEQSGRVSPEQCVMGSSSNSSTSSSCSPVPVDVQDYTPHSRMEPNIVMDKMPMGKLNVGSVEDDMFEPIPLTKIHEMVEPASFAPLSAQTTCPQVDDELLMFEPRPIEDMVDHPNKSSNFYNMTPSLAPRQQAWVEYALPLVLPLIFYVCELSRFGVLWCSVIIVGHTLQTLFTAFGPAAADLSFKPSIEMLQHHFMDCIWVQCLVSAMLLTPQHFGVNSVYTGAGLILLVPIYLTVSLKTHFEQNVLENATDATTARSIKRRQKLMQQLGETLRDTVAWYLASIAVVLLGHHTFSFNLIVLGVFVLNAAPISTLASYTYQFKKSSDLLIRKQKML